MCILVCSILQEKITILNFQIEKYKIEKEKLEKTNSSQKDSVMEGYIKKLQNEIQGYKNIGEKCKTNCQELMREIEMIKEELKKYRQ